MTRRRAVIFSAILLILFACSASAQTRVHVFIRSLIPKSHAGNPGYVLGTSDPGKFVIESPIAGDGSCFLTDNRLFSNAVDASSRITTEFVLVISDTAASVEKASGRELFRVGPTHKVNCQTGADLVPPMSALTSDMHMGHPAFADGIAQVVVDALASNPLAFPIPPELSRFLIPHIAYSGHFTFDTGKNTLRFQGSTGVFPAYEAYAQLNDGPVTMLFTSLPASGSTAKDLFDFGTGFKLQAIDQTVSLPDTINGIWQSNDPNKRFQLKISDTTVIWTEKNEAGATLARTVSLNSGSAAGRRQIDRPNDDGVLSFLGFQPALRAAVLAHAPKSSFMVLSRNGVSINGVWNGLLVIKDAHGQFQSMKQPGEAPSKAFVFTRVQ